MKELRPYQRMMVQSTREAFGKTVDGKRVRAVVLPAPTGAGKTVVGAYMIKAALARNPNAKVVWLNELDVLCEQSAREFRDAWGIPTFVWKGPNRHRDYAGEGLVVSSPQTIRSRKDKVDAGAPPYDLPFTPNLVLVDEAHLDYLVTKTLIEDLCLGEDAETFAIGLTATPVRKMGHVWQWQAWSPPYDDLVGEGRLVKGNWYSAEALFDMSRAKTRNGEWTAASCEEGGSLIIGDIVGEWRKVVGETFGREVPTIAFVPTVDYGLDLAAEFRNNGIEAQTISYRDGQDAKAKELRRRKLKALGEGRIKVLISVDALGRGLDVPEVQCVILGRPFKGGYHSVVQQVGRGARPCEGKDQFLVLDHVENLERFGPEILEIFSSGHMVGPMLPPADPKRRPLDFDADEDEQDFTDGEAPEPESVAGTLRKYAPVLLPLDDKELWRLISHWAVSHTAKMRRYTKGASQRKPIDAAKAAFMRCRTPAAVQSGAVRGRMGWPPWEWDLDKSGLPPSRKESAAIGRIDRRGWDIFKASKRGGEWAKRKNVAVDERTANGTGAVK